MRTILLALMLFSALLPQLARAAPASPVTMTAFLDKSVYRIGQPIVLEVDLHNSRTHRILVSDGAYEWYAFQFVLLDTAGRSVPRTARGQEMLHSHEVYVNPPTVFGPRATHRYRINLAALFLVSRGNSYTLHVSHTVRLEAEGTSLPLAAGPFKFHIMEAAAPRNAPATPFVHDPSARLNIP